MRECMLKETSSLSLHPNTSTMRTIKPLPRMVGMDLMHRALDALGSVFHQTPEKQVHLYKF